MFSGLYDCTKKRTYKNNVLCKTHKKRAVFEVINFKNNSNVDNSFVFIVDYYVFECCDKLE